MEGVETFDCDREVAEIVSAGNNDGENNNGVESHHHRSQEEEVHHAAQLSETELELAEQLPKLISKLKEDETKVPSSGASSGSGSSGESNKSDQDTGSPKVQEKERKTSTTFGPGADVQKAASDVDHSASSFRLKLGGFQSGRSSRKGSSCSTPVSAMRTEMEYPSPNFIRPNGLSQCPGVSVDESSKLTIRLHYNPVMDEWLSLTEEGKMSDSSPRKTDESDILFDLHKVDSICDDNEEIIKIGPFLESLEATGIRKTDPRLATMMKHLKKLQRESDPPMSNLSGLQLGRGAFKESVSSCIQLLSRAFRGKFVVPEFGYFCKQITELYHECKSNGGGKVADYIPQLAKYNPEYWGVSICTVDGQRFSIGDVNIPFTLQSSSKPFTYSVCLNELGANTVHQYVGQEPSGRMFNELSLDFNNKPHNPLLNSGAIMSCAILLNLVKPEMKISEKFDFLMDYLKIIGGGEHISFNNSVFLSERETADRNFALAYYMKENQSFPKGFILQETLDFYFQTCSMEVNCETLAVMGATLANGGVCPTTSKEAVSPEAVRDVLSLMHSCGMYNYSGQFAFDVGLPAKSGVSGALVLVIPNVCAIGLWSPPLDALGNTVRGVQFAKQLVRSFNFHRFDHLLKTGSKSDPRKFRNEHLRSSTLSLLYSATAGDLTALKRFHFSGVNMSNANYDGRTALHLAAAEGHASCVKFLVESCKLNPLAKDRWGFTPLIEAERFQHDFVFRYLAKHVEDNYPEALEELLKKSEEKTSSQR